MVRLRDSYGLTGLGIIVICVTVVTMVVALSCTLVYTLDRQTCYSQLNDMKREGDYGFWTGCMVELRNGDRVPLDNFRSFNEER